MSAGGAAALVVLVGLTGAGKSTAVAALRRARPDLTLLPNRRELADRIVLPEAQRLQGREPEAVTDRLERFALSARYRAEHRGGLAHALARHLAQDAEAHPSTLLFDNLRGADEVGFAVDAFPGARFVAIEADAATRVLRVAGRHDAFDVAGPEAAAGPTSTGPVATDPDAGGPCATSGAPARAAAAGELALRLAHVPGLPGLVDPAALASAAAGLPPDAVVTAARVVAEESTHYDPDAAWAVLEPLPGRRRLRLDTSRMSKERVVEALLAWW